MYLSLSSIRTSRSMDQLLIYVRGHQPQLESLCLWVVYFCRKRPCVCGINSRICGDFTTVYVWDKHSLVCILGRFNPVANRVYVCRRVLCLVCFLFTHLIYTNLTHLWFHTSTLTSHAKHLIYINYISMSIDNYIVNCKLT